MAHLQVDFLVCHVPRVVFECLQRVCGAGSMGWPTCFTAVTEMTKTSGRMLVMGVSGATPGICVDRP